MELRVYLNTGEILDFVQNEPQQIQTLISELPSVRVLSSGKALIFGDGASCALIRPEAVARMDMMTAEPLTLPNILDASVTLIEDESFFRSRAKAAVAAFREGVAPGEEYLGYIRLGLLGGHRVLVEIRRTLREQVQFFSNLNRLMGLPGLVFPHPQGGAIMVNLANVSVIETFPGFADYPKGSFPVMSLSQA